MSSYYKFYKSVPIDVYHRGELVEDYAPWNLGIWEYQENRLQWGLMHGNQPTQMAYGLAYAKPKDGISRRYNEYEKDPDPDWLLWYFDVGAKLTVKIEDLEQAFKDLGIWEEDQ